jgi:hypothetical protein
MLNKLMLSPSPVRGLLYAHIFETLFEQHKNAKSPRYRHAALLFDNEAASSLTRLKVNSGYRIKCGMTIESVFVT